MPNKLLEYIKETNAEFVDFRFTDPRGKWQHVAIAASKVDMDLLKNGFMFDGSSIAGWKKILESDMVLIPDVKTAVADPYSAQPSVIVVCDVYDPVTNAPYERDPRSIARAAEKYLKDSKIGDTAFFGPEPEFFIFDDVRFDVSMNKVSHQIDSEEGPYNSDRDYDGHNYGHRPGVKGGYFPVPPVDGSSDIRSEMVSVMSEMGLNANKHHHEVAPSQHELGIDFDTLTHIADKVQIYKYVVHNTAHAYGKTATFLPKPIKEDNGSGMHVHQSIWKAGKPLFAGKKYADLSDEALYYIGGVLKHARALNAFTNASTNSYKRLVPGYEAPVLLTYSYRNRSAGVRIPHSIGPKAKRCEMRFPDCTANPYLGFAAMLMAGIDGIKNKIDPGKPMDVDLYNLGEEKLKDVPTVCRSFREALEALDKDRGFLTAGNVFSNDQIDAYIDLRMEEVEEYEQTPHPAEFKMYYSV